MRAAARRLALAAALCTIATPSPAVARSQERGDPRDGAARHAVDLPTGATVIDIPYLPQSELLCGGAAAAMVLRYWGLAGVRAQDFSHLVTETRGGMRADELSAQLRELGWDVFPFAGRFEEVRRHLRLGRPVVSLIEVAGGRFHYVVLVGEAGDRLVLHDPAASPYRLVDRGELEDAWEATNGLSLLIVPPPDRARNVRPPVGLRGSADAKSTPRAPAPDTPDGAEPPALSPECRGRLDRALAAATAGRLGEADNILSERPCAGEPVFLRELAGVRLRRGGATGAAEAVVLARRALALEPGDSHAVRTLATALYVSDRPEAALDAWNRVEEPTVDLVRVGGLDRVSHRPVARLLGVRGGDRLTASSLELARRRLADLPAAGLSRVSYVPTGGGRVDLVAGLAERPGLSISPLLVATTTVRAAIHRELSLTAISPFGQGETWSGTWRWWENRPAASFRLASPSDLGPPSILALTVGWERESYAPATGNTPLALPPREQRAGAAIESSLWLLPELHASLRLGLDRWVGTGSHVRTGITGEVRALEDRVRLAADADRWLSLEHHPGFGTMRVRIDGFTRTRPEGLLLSARSYVHTATADAPGTLWPGAGVGIARPDLLRAHTLLDDGKISGRTFDRRLAGAGVELVRWFPFETALRIGAAAFMDAAHTWGARQPASFADAGVGVRITTARGGPMLRIDVATGLSDDEWALSAGWSTGAHP